ncbi:sugar phosphate isomerase/epimerase [Paenibacillus sp. Mc5Re-14]|uniref:sugar phosphate isomerase/epimerase family protein n=1 Tax=Paenibacillus sp. Mc5Re-14 TaxID=1030529 RepID=UPI000A870864|nr:sugar phosphate isomerase/epimerase [Paenibacillus sp. Mc5Re-14]
MTKVGLQLYTVREELEQDFEGTLRKVAELGYKGVEFHSFFGRSAKDVRALLDELNLEVVGTHIQYSRLLHHLDEEIAYHKELGNKYLIVPYLTEEEREWDDLFVNLNRIGKKVKEHGLILAYHNHDFELTEKINDHPVFDALYDAVPDDLLQVEMDTCWVYYAGYDPVEYIGRYRGRLPIIHLKDMARDEQKKAVTVELGQGEVQLQTITDAAIEAGVDWVVVEQDFSSNPPIESIETSMKWLQQYAAQGGNIHV